MNKYLNLANTLRAEIQSSLYKPGEKIPSLREIQSIKSCSLSTAKEAYRILSEEGIIIVKKQSGYFVNPYFKEAYLNLQNKLHENFQADDRIQTIMRDVLNPKLLRLGAAIPESNFFPIKAMEQSVKKSLRYSNYFDYGDLEGYKPLKQKIAQLLIRSTSSLSSDKILITNGCTEAISYSLLACTSPGDTILLPSPTYMGIFQILESLRLRVIEIPYREETQLDLFEMEKLIKKHRPTATIISANFNNPNGMLLSDKLKEKIAELLVSYNVSLIEDDIYGDLYFGTNRPKSLISFVNQLSPNRIIRKSYINNGISNSRMDFYCSSFSKTISPGLRIGWIASKNNFENVTKIARALKLVHNNPNQIAIYEYLKSNSYEKHLQNLRIKYFTSLNFIRNIFLENSKSKIKIQLPNGGFVLWIETQKDSKNTFNQAHRIGISIAPGRLFGISDQWKNCFRINTAFAINESREASLLELARLI